MAGDVNETLTVHFGSLVDEIKTAHSAILIDVLNFSSGETS